MGRVRYLALIIVAALAVVPPLRAQNGPCAMGGVEPGMASADVTSALGRPSIQMKHDADSGAGMVTTMGWTNPDSVVEVDVSDKGQVVRVYWNQQKGALKGPFGVRLGKDNLRDAVRRMGADSVAAGPARCSGGKVQVPLSATCGDQGGKFTILLDVPANAFPCDAAPAKDALLDGMARTLIREAFVEK